MRKVTPTPAAFQRRNRPSRSASTAYALAAAKALPHAAQVAHRLPLMENASHAFLDAVRESMRQIRGATRDRIALLHGVAHIELNAIGPCV